MGLRFLPTNFSSPDIQSPLTSISPWLRPSPEPSPLQRIPVEIFHRIVSYLLHQTSHLTCSKRQAIFTLSLTCSLFHRIFRNDVYSSITIRSTSFLTELTAYLDTHTWPGQTTAINSLTLRWLQETNNCLFATPISRHEASQKITMNLKIILEKHTEGLKSLIIDFPGAGISFQTAILTAPTFIYKQHLKHLHIANGLCPLNKPATFLLCAISALCAQAIEELVIDITYEALNGSPYESYTNELRVPGRQMFRNFERLHRLKKLHVKGLDGFTDGCLAWVLSGSQLLHSRGKGKVLILEGCRALTEGGVRRILGIVGGGLEGSRVTFATNESIKPVFGESSGTPAPGTWWPLDYEDQTGPKADNDPTPSFMYDDNSTIATVEREETIYEDEIFHLDTFGDSFNTTSHSSNKESHCYYNSYKPIYSHRSIYNHQSIHQPSHDSHICDIATTACQFLPRLSVPTPLNLQYSYLDHQQTHKENKSRISHSSAPGRYPTPTLSDKDSEFSNHHFSSRVAARISAPIIHSLQATVSPHPGYSSLPIPSSSAPIFGFLNREVGKLSKLRGGEMKRMYKPADGASVARGFKSMSLSGLWEGVGGVGGRRGWFKCQN